MLSEYTGLASSCFLILDLLEEEYGVDVKPLIAEFGIDERLRAEPGARIPSSVMQAMLERVPQLTDDTTFGIKLGQRATPATYYVLGYAVHASQSLGEALERIVRYDKIVSTVMDDAKYEKVGDLYCVSESYPDPALRPELMSVDAEAAGLLMLCEAVAGEPVYPVKVELMAESCPHPEAHAELFKAPVTYGADHNAMYFSAEDVERPIETALPELAEASDRIADRYLEEIDGKKITAQVRRLLIQTLPSGTADQESVAARLFRSSSTLQRQLSTEGTSYRDVLESTRRNLAEDYLRAGQHSHAQVAYLLGFSDQSNFARAFKRWHGVSPGKFQKNDR